MNPQDGARTSALVGAAVALAIAAAAAATAPSGLAGDFDRLPPMRFAWRVPCRVRVNETLQLGCTAIGARYTLCLDRSADGQGYELYLSNISPRSPFGAESRYEPSVRWEKDYAAMVDLAYGCRPRLRIGGDGRVEGALDVAACAQRFAACTRALQRDRAGSRADTKEDLAQAAEALAYRMRHSWEILVGDWIGVELQQGSPQVSPAEWPRAGTGARTGTRALTYRGPAGRDLELVRLESVEVYEGTRGAAPRAGAPPGAPPQEDTDRMELHATLLTDPRTLAPRHAQWRMAFPNARHVNANSVESFTMDFEWPDDRPRRDRR